MGLGGAPLPLTRLLRAAPAVGRLGPLRTYQGERDVTSAGSFSYSYTSARPHASPTDATCPRPGLADILVRTATHPNCPVTAPHRARGSSRCKICFIPAKNEIDWKRYRRCLPQAGQGPLRRASPTRTKAYLPQPRWRVFKAISCLRELGAVCCHASTKVSVHSGQSLRRMRRTAGRSLKQRVKDVCTIIYGRLVRRKCNDGVAEDPGRDSKAFPCTPGKLQAPFSHNHYLRIICLTHVALSQSQVGRRR